MLLLFVSYYEVNISTLQVFIIFFTTMSGQNKNVSRKNIILSLAPTKSYDRNLISFFAFSINLTSTKQK